MSPNPKPLEKEVVKNPSVTIHDSLLLDSLHFMKTNKFMGDLSSTVHFDSVKELEDYAREEVVSAIVERVNSLKQDISELQKHGYVLALESLELLQVPLKYKVWLSTHKRKDLEGAFALINKVSPRVSLLKKELEEKLKQKEAAELLKEKSQKEKDSHKK